MVAMSSPGSFSNDTSIMARAFIQAQQDDTLQVLNAMAAKKTPSSLSDLAFYMVPASWMIKAWAMLDMRTNGSGNSGMENDDEDGKWRESIGPIQTSELLAVDEPTAHHNTISSSSDEEGTATSTTPTTSTPSGGFKPTNGATQRLKNDLKHGVDFFLLGSSVWLLVGQKFGHDGEIKRECVLHELENSVLAVAIDDNLQNGGTHGSSATPNGHQHLVPIPPAGYFDYKRLVEDLEGDSGEPFLHQPEQQQQQQQTTVSDDDDDGGDNDLFPGSDDPMAVSSEPESRPGNTAQHEGSGPVILLPPSTTSTISPANSNNNESLYPNVQDMECGDAANTDEAKEYSAADDTAQDLVTTARCTPATPASTVRPHGSGLGNLGNTCFMNSTLQCLAHTDPLRHYFLSREYEKDLNRDNPLGTGGDLASEFARLLAEMWGTALPGGRKIETSTYVSNVVYPRDFKYTLGKHAEQFMGYDQHDSQELATYLLDALHEDTNRVTRKPYVEKPEQGEDEPDEVAAQKAWDLHLKREDSRVLEYFMGQVKSRVKCCKPGCGRVSTTFDPFMYLSVPIPGATDRTLRLTFVPLDGQIRRKELNITLNRNATIGKLLSKVSQQLMKAGFISNDGKPFTTDELYACDVWSKEIYHWYTEDEDIDKIRDNDETFVYQVQGKADIQKMEEDGSPSESTTSEDLRIAEAIENIPYRVARYKPDHATTLSLHHEGWKASLESYMRMNQMQVLRIFNARRGTSVERFELYQKLDSFIVSCIKECDKASNKRAREEDDGEESSPSPNPQEQILGGDGDTVMVRPEEEEIPALIERSEKSDMFKSVKSRYDLAVLDFCASKLKRMIVQSSQESKKKNEGGNFIQVHQRRTSPLRGSTYSTGSDKGVVNPLVMRIPATMTVYGLRAELAKRLARSLRLPPEPIRPEASDPAATITTANDDQAVSTESDVIPMEESDRGDDAQLSAVDSMTVSSDAAQNYVGDPALLIMRQMPLSYGKRRQVGGGYNKATKPLGSLEGDGSSDGSRPISLASPTDDDERALVNELLDDKGCVYLEWPADLCMHSFDEMEFEASEVLKDPDEEEASAARSRNNQTISILDCVQKYCDEEQLEETEMWYCNRCKEHVRAWKQFTIYQAPPILIIHLKRFQYSASTHRRDKINTFIDFPLIGLDLSEQVMHFAEGEKPIYDCYAVSNHYGGLGGGHYTAYCLNDDGVWCYYDDSRINENVDPKDVVSDAAYVVYYRRRDVVVEGNFLESLGAACPAIITDHVDKVPTPSEASSTNAAADMDVDTGDADSRASSHTYSSPMDSNDGADAQIGIGIYAADEDDFYGPSHDTNDAPINSYPSQ